MGQCPFEPHKLGKPGATPGPAISLNGRVRKPEKRSGREPDDFAGSTPVSATLMSDRVVQWLRHLLDTQEIEGSIPSAITGSGL